MDGSQVTGAASSYARKYSLSGLFGLDDTKDSDATNTHGKEEAKPIQIQSKPLQYYKTIIDSLDSIEGCMSFYNDYLADIKSNADILQLLKTKKSTFFTISNQILQSLHGYTGVFGGPTYGFWIAKADVFWLYNSYDDKEKMAQVFLDCTLDIPT